MTRILVKIDNEGALSKLTGLEKQVNFATAKALTQTAGDVKAGIVAAMDSAFVSPTPFTKNALFVRPARRDNLVASVSVKDKQSRYLWTEIEGGERNVKGFENLLIRAGIMPSGWYAIPASSAPRDSFGNVSGGTLNRILSQLQAARDPQANEPGRFKTKRNRKPVGRYFAVKPADGTHLRPGIYERTALSAHSPIRPIFVFTPTRPKYRKRLDFYGIGCSIAQAQFPVRFRAALADALATAK